MSETWSSALLTVSVLLMLLTGGAWAARGKPAKPVNTAPPTIVGTAVQGQSLTADPGSWSGVQPITYGYQWRRCDSAGAGCVSILGATGKTYTLSSADAGSTLRVRVVATNSAGSGSATSAATAVVQAAPVAPSNTSPPTIAGTALEGQTLTADPGSWSGTEPIGYGYQWQRCDSGGGSCGGISGATAISYVLRSADVGSTIRVQVTATNAAGSATASSAETSIVAPVSSAPVADFSASPTSGIAPLDVSFTDASGGSPTSWSWDFGDGSTSTAQNPGHTYASAGSYAVSLTVTNANGADTMMRVGYISTHDPVVAAAGDIACPPGSAVTASTCQQQATSQLLLGEPYDAVLTLGDHQYDNGELANFQQVFEPTWGRVKSVMHPAPGNHEYQTAGASGYFDYFGSLAGPSRRGYYSFDLGSWHIVSLNSEIAMGVGSPQETWLKSDLAAHPNECILGFWHQPLYSSDSSYAPGIAAVRPLYADLYNAGAELVLNGHAHDYERFAPQTPNGTLDRSNGVREFIVGTGGRSLRGLGTRLPNSEVFSSSSFGVLKLVLKRGGYDWRFIPAAGGTLQDSGSSSCSTAGSTAPPAPVADFRAAPTSGTAPLAVEFADASSNNPTSWSWNFGDGTTSNVQNPQHTYATPGTYTATLTASNAAGSSVAMATITVATPTSGGGIVAVGAQSGVSSSAVATVTLQTPSGASAGDLLVAGLTPDNNPSVSAPAGWTPIVGPLKPNGGAEVLAYYHFVAPGETAASYTWGLSSAQKWGGGIVAYRGVDPSHPLDVASPATKIDSNGGATSITAPGVTTVTGGAMLIGGLGADGSTANTIAPTGWTEAFDSVGGQMSEHAYRLQATAGASGPVTWTLDSGRAAAVWMSALRPAG
jgi:PKD repeat protein